MAVELASGYVSLSVQTGGVDSGLAKMWEGAKASATKAGKDAGSAYAKSVSQEAKTAEAQVQKISANIVKLRDKEADAAGKVRVATEKLNEARKGGASASKLAQLEEALATAQRRGVAASRDLAREQDGLARAEKRLTDAMKADENQAKKTSTAHNIMSKSLGAVGGAVDKASSKLKGFGKAVAVGVGFGAGFNIGGITSSLMEMGDTFANVNKKLAFSTGATGEKLNSLNASVRNIGKDSPKSLTDIADSMSEVARATQLTGDPLEKLTKQVIKLDALGQGTSIEGVTQAMRAFGVPADQMSGKLDEVFKVARATGVPLEDLMGTLQKGAPQLQQFGLGIGDSAGLLAELHHSGIDTDKAMVGLNSALKVVSKQGGDVKTNLSNAVGEIKKMSDAGNQAGAIAAASKLFGGKAFGPMLKAIQEGKFNLEGLNAELTANQSGILDSGGAIVTMSGAWQMFKNNVLILIEPLVTRIFGWMQQGILWFRTTGVGIIRDFGAKITEIWNSKPVQDFVAKVKETFDNVFPKIKDIIGTISDKITEFGPVVGTILVDAFNIAAGAVDTLVTAVTKISDWIGAHTEDLIGVGVAVGGIVTAVAIQNIADGGGKLLDFAKNLDIVKTAQSAWNAVVKAGTAIQAAFNFVMSMNPISKVIMVLSLLAAGLVFAYNHCETFRNIVDKAWAGIKKAIEVVWNWINDTLLPGIKTVWDGIAEGAQWLWHTIIEPVWNGIAAAIGVAWGIIKGIFKIWKFEFQILAAAAKWLWDNGIKPAWEAIKSGLAAAWNWIKDNVFSKIKDAWDTIAAGAKWLYDNGIKPAWDGIKDAIAAVWQWLSDNVFDKFKAAWDAIAFAAQWFWNNVITPVWDGIKNAFQAAWDFISPIFDKIKSGWDTLKDGVTGAATAIKDGVTAAFNGLAGIIKAPLHALGSFLKNVPDKVLGVEIPFVATLHNWGENLAGLRTGGAIRDSRGLLRGPGTGTSDSILGINGDGRAVVRVSNGEGVVRADVMSRGGNKIVAALNAGWVPSADYLRAMLPGFAGGGTIEDAIRFAQAAGDGRPYVYGGVGPDGWDCSGFMSSIYAAFTGQPRNKRYFDTESNFEALGFQPGFQEGSFNIGIRRGGGGKNSHMAGTLPNGVNVESGGATDSTMYGGKAVGAMDFPLKFHLPLSGNPLGQTSSSSYGGVSGVSSSGSSSGVSSVEAQNKRNQQVADGEAKIGKLQDQLAVAQKQLEEAKADPKTKESTMMARENAVKDKQAALDKAKADLDELKSKPLETKSGGKGGSDSDNPFAKIIDGFGQLGELAKNGAIESFLPPGFDNPLDTPLMKMGGGLLKFIGGLTGDPTAQGIFNIAGGAMTGDVSGMAGSLTSMLFPSNNNGGATQLNGVGASDMGGAYGPGSVGPVDGVNNSKSVDNSITVNNPTATDTVKSTINAASNKQMGSIRQQFSRPI